MPPTKQAAKKENETPGNPKVEARLRELEKLALAKKRELEASSKALAKTKKLADDLAKRLHEAKAGKTRTQSNREVGLKLPKAAPPKRKAPAKARKPPPTRGKDGGPTDVTSTLTKAAVKGATKLEIDNSHEWEVGSKVVIGRHPTRSPSSSLDWGALFSPHHWNAHTACTRPSRCTGPRTTRRNSSTRPRPFCASTRYWEKIGRAHV